MRPAQSPEGAPTLRGAKSGAGGGGDRDGEGVEESTSSGTSDAGSRRRPPSRSWKRLTSGRGFGSDATCSSRYTLAFMMAASRTSVDRRHLIDEVCERFSSQLGFQADSVKNQAEHVEALWGSFCSRHEDSLEALEDLRGQLLSSHGEWHEKVWLPLFGLRGSAFEGDSSDLEERAASAAGAAGLLSPEQQPVTAASLGQSGAAVEDLCLFLLLWGEMGNLRFCPELHCFLFSAARAYCASKPVMAPARFLGHASSPDHSFLNGVVRPIFDVMLSETFVPGAPPRPRFGAAAAPPDVSNYDDWNEVFWDADRLRRSLRLRSAREPRGDLRALDACSTAGELWPLLAQVDWARSLRGVKSHREVHSFLPILVGCYRIFLLQSLCLGILVVDWEAMHELGSWLDRSALMLLVPFWMTLHELGYFVISPPVSWRARARGMLKLLLLYASPIATFALVALDVEGLWRPGFLRPSDWQHFVLVFHFFVGSIALLAAMLPQQLNFHDWGFYPRLPKRRSLGSYFFWLAVVVVAMGLNSKLVRSCADALLGLWTLSRDSEDRWVILLQVGVLAGPTVLCFIGSLLFFLNLAIAFGGGLSGVIRLGGFRLFWYRRGLGYTNVPGDLARRVLQPTVEKDKPKPSRKIQEPIKAMKWWKWMTDSELQAFVEVWEQMLIDLRKRDLISDKEHESLSFGPEGAQAAARGEVPRLWDPTDVLHIRNALPASPEARRRIIVLARSVEHKSVPSAFVRSSPTLSVLIPHYAEEMLYTRDALFADDVPAELLRFLVKYYQEDFANFAERSAREGGGGGGANGSEGGATRLPSDLERRLCEWASLRMQTLWRTVEGICNSYSSALQALVRIQEPSFSEDQRNALVKDKFQVVLAMQKYAHFADPSKGDNAHMLSAAEAMLAAFGPYLRIAFIEEEDGPLGRQYFSSLIDASCPIVQKPGKLPARKPRLRIELPGFPILGHGKSDNQNCAVVFTRGEVLQMIDCNQEAYMESALFLPAALREFGETRDGRRPGILGFREHIFSDIGLLGRLAADNEFAFGTIIQRTMDMPMEARLHYGHPDMMDKLQVLQQGGVSKATKGLNLSEDVFAGLDLNLRGGWTRYKEYFHVGKGRDMGFMSVLSFFAKVSMGNGEQAITRQWLRLALGLPLPRLLGIFYTHIGFFLNQCLVNWAMKAFAFMAALFAISARVYIGVDDAAIAEAVTYFGFFYFLFLTTTMAPLLVEVGIEFGLGAALGSFGSSLMALSPVFAVFHSKLMGFYFWTTLHYGGAQYIATGRGLATSRESFGRMFRTFSPTHTRDGFEVVVYLMFSVGSNFGPGFYLCSFFTVFSWTVAPFLFNPRQFNHCSQARQDLTEWLRWMWSAEGGEEQSWVAWATKLQEVRQNSSRLVELTPSARQVALLCTLTMVLTGAPFEALHSETLSLMGSIGPPGASHFLLCCFVSFTSISPALVGENGISRVPFLSLMAISLLLLEFGLVTWYENTWRMVLFNKYIWVRCLLELLDGIAARRPGGSSFTVLHDACRLWVFSWRFARDLIIGVTLSVLLALLASLPGLSRCHDVFLFRARIQKEEVSPEAKEIKSPAYASADSDSDSGSELSFTLGVPSLSERETDALAAFVKWHAKRKRRLLHRLRRH